MNTHNYINKTLILSFLSIVHSYINITILNTCKQIYVLILIEIYIVTHVYKKIKPSFPHHTEHLKKYCQQKLLLNAL